MKPKRPAFDRDRQVTPEEIVSDLMTVIRNKFYGDRPDQFFKDQNFLRRNVVLWPARWLDEKAVTLKPFRYREILIDIFNQVAIHGTETVKYWPGYLMSCVQRHFAIHGEEYYEEGKSLRAALDKSLFAITRAQATPATPDPIRIMARAQTLAKPPKRRPKSKPASQGFLSL
jgi:hypothetical protein